MLSSTCFESVDNSAWYRELVWEWMDKNIEDILTFRCYSFLLCRPFRWRKSRNRLQICDAMPCRWLVVRSQPDFKPLVEENGHTTENEKEQQFLSPPLYILYASLLSRLLSENGALVSSYNFLNTKIWLKTFFWSPLKQATCRLSQPLSYRRGSWWAKCCWVNGLTDDQLAATDRITGSD